MLTIHTTNLAGSHHTNRNQKPDQIISVLPPSEVAPYNPDAEFPDVLRSLPKPQPATRHDWIHVHDAMYGDTNLSRRNRRANRRIDRKAYADPQHLPATKHAYQIAQALDHALTRHRNGTHTVLIHCAGGVSRSQAVTYCLTALALGPDQFANAYRLVRTANPNACPNPLIIFLVDRHLGMSGKLIAPIIETGPLPSIRSANRPLAIHINNRAQPRLIIQP